MLVGTTGIVLAVVAGDVFDRFLWQLMLAPLLPTAAALLHGERRWWSVAAISATAVSIGVISTVLAAGGSVGDVGRGAIRGPRLLLTTEWPSPTEPSVIAAIALLLAVLTALAAALAADRRFHLAPLTPLIVCLTCLTALSAPSQPDAWLLALAGFMALLLALTRQDRNADTRNRSQLTDRTLPLTTIVLTGVVIAASATLAWADRADPRSTQDAVLSAALLDPIEAVVALRNADPPIALMRITDRSGNPSRLPGRWRVAALDSYDGQRWVPTLTLHPIGRTLAAGSTTNDATTRLRYEVEYLTDELDTIPFPGQPVSVDTDVETDRGRVVVRLPERPQAGTRVQAISAAALGAGAARGASVVTRQVDEIGGGFSERAGSLAGDGTVIEQLRLIEQTMRTEWQLDSLAPGGGQQLALLERFVVETRRGTREQFVTAFVELVRSLGFDARVATGFLLPDDQLLSPLTIASTHAAIWPEVQFEGVGWLPFDPTPETESFDIEQPPPPPEAQSPAAAQPPIVPPAEAVDDIEEAAVDDQIGNGRWRSVRTWLIRIGAASGIGVLPFVALFGSVLALKRRRRRSRLQADDPFTLVRGVWANTTDALVDAGLSIAPAWTDNRIAEHAAALAPAAPHEMRRLASMSTSVTFGATTIDTDTTAWRLVDDAMSTSDAVLAAIRLPLTRWQRIRWLFSLRSLRRSTRSPVVV